MDIKIVLALLATVFSALSVVPYLHSIFKGTTQPHAYTWLIWLITQGTAAAAILHGGGAWGSLNLIVGSFLVLLIFLLSFKYGTRNITRGDTAVLILALFAIGVWLFMKNPLLALLLVTGIDALGYVPTYRKLFQEPWSEPLSSWLLFIASGVCTLLALSAYNVLTLTYIAMTMVANLVLVGLALVRRRTIPKLA